MSNIDISALGALEPTQPIDLSQPVEKPKSTGTFPRAGRYTVRVPEQFTVDPTMSQPGTIGKTKAGVLAARVDPTVVGPANEGYQIRFTNISAKVWQRDGKDTSQVAQYLQAFGIKDELSGEPEQTAGLIADTANQTADVYADWVVEHRPSGYKLIGMRNFPVDETGTHRPWVEHPDENLKGEDGQRLRLRARLEVRRWLPKSE